MFEKYTFYFEITYYNNISIKIHKIVRELIVFNLRLFGKFNLIIILMASVSAMIILWYHTLSFWVFARYAY